MAKAFLKPDVEHKLFKELSEKKPVWWQNLVNDNKELYINIRQDNHINVYYNGGSLLNLEYRGLLKGRINFEYIPLLKNKDYVPFTFEHDHISLPEMKPLPLENFGKSALLAIKKRISKFYGPNSEKGIQADFVLKNGSFIDTEFQPVSNRKIRFDLVWVDVTNVTRKKIFVVELKTIEDSRLMFDPDKVLEHETVGKIHGQLTKYYEFIRDQQSNIIAYYQAVFQIQKKLGILPKNLRNLGSLEGFTIEPWPILLVGDCTQDWINKNAERINTKLKDVAYGCFYQGKSTREFIIPAETKGYRFILPDMSAISARVG